MRPFHAVLFASASIAVACGAFSSTEDTGLDTAPGGEVLLPDGGRVAPGYDASADGGDRASDGAPAPTTCDVPPGNGCAPPCLDFTGESIAPWTLDGDPAALTRTCGTLVFASGRVLELQRESSAGAEVTSERYAATLEFDMKVEPDGPLPSSPIVKVATPATAGDDDFVTRLNLRLVDNAAKLALEGQPGLPLGTGWVHVRLEMVDIAAPSKFAATLVVGASMSPRVERTGRVGSLTKIELGKIDEDDTGFVLRLDNVRLIHTAAE